MGYRLNYRSLSLSLYDYLQQIEEIQRKENSLQTVIKY